MVSILASGLCCPWYDFQHFSEEKIIDVAEVNQLHWLEESGQWLENVDRTHLLVTRGKLVLQKLERVVSNTDSLKFYHLR